MPCPHGRVRSACKECGGGSICPHGRLRTICKECGGGSICVHGRRRSRCKECGGSGLCPHGRRRDTCKECGGGSICVHGRRRSGCKECGGSSICAHGRHRHRCKECGGSSICAHGRERSVCKECGGGSFCAHGRKRTLCKECGGGSICVHGRRRSRCKECGGGSICVHGRERSNCKECKQSSGQKRKAIEAPDQPALCPMSQSTKARAVEPGTFLVEQILARREQQQGTEYLVKWEGYPEADNTWEPTTHVPAHLAAAFNKSHSPARAPVCQPAVEPLQSAPEAGMESEDDAFEISSNAPVEQMTERQQLAYLLKLTAVGLEPTAVQPEVEHAERDEPEPAEHDRGNVKQPTAQLPQSEPAEAGPDHQPEEPLLVQTVPADITIFAGVRKLCLNPVGAPGRPALISSPEEERIPIWNCTTQRKLGGKAAPKWRNLAEYLRKHPKYALYTGQDKLLTALEKQAQIATQNRIPVWNKSERRVSRGSAAPMADNLDKYLREHPECELYTGQDKLLTALEKQAQIATQNRIPVWHKSKCRVIRGNAAPMADNLDKYLRDRPECEVYSGQDGKRAGATVALPSDDEVASLADKRKREEPIDLSAWRTSSNKSGFIRVYLTKSGKFEARGPFDQGKPYLGAFATAELAAEAVACHELPAQSDRSDHQPTDDWSVVEELLESRAGCAAGSDGALTVGAGRKRGVEYLVKWEGYSAKHNSWEPADNILDRGLITEYEARIQAQQAGPEHGHTVVLDDDTMIVDGFMITALH